MKPLKLKGFTLTEVLVATALVVLISITLFFTFTTTLNNLRHIMELRTATLILQEELSEIRELKFLDIQNLGGSFSPSSISSLKDATGTISRSYYDGHNEIIKITLKLEWTTFDGKTASKTIVTLMTDHGINKK